MLAWIFIMHSSSPQPTPEVRSIAGQGVWSYQPATGPASTSQAPFAAAAGTGFVARAAAAMAAPAASPAAAADSQDVAHSPLDYAGYAAVVRSAAEDHDSSVGIKPVKQDGRDMWRAAMRLDGDVVELLVDERTGIVQWCDVQSENAAGLPRQEFRVTRISYDSANAPASPSPSSSASTHGTLWTGDVPGDLRFYPTLRAAAAAAGFTPVTSSLAPDGYRLAAAGVGRGTGLEGLEAAPAKLPRRLDLLYVRDLSSFTVSEFPLAHADASWLERVSRATTAQLAWDESLVQYGLFNGAQAQTWFSAAGPTMLVSGHGYVVLVRGSLSRQELEDMAAGFARRG